MPSFRALSCAIVTLALTGCDDGGGDPCDGQSCSGHGECAVVSGDARCLCDDGYVEEGLACGLEGGDGDADSDVDSDVDGDADTGPTCTDGSDCDDGLFCNGEEACDPAGPDADAFGCTPGEAPDCDDGLPSTEDTCSEELGDCLHSCPDVDGDGHADVACVDSEGDPMGDDCDDLDPFRYPGNVEVCDPGQHDEDCDISTVGDTDVDDDGFVSDACCNFAEGEGMDAPVCGTDCADDNGDVNPDATEVCDVDDTDEDCDGEVNELLTIWCYADADNDSFAAAGEERTLECPVEGRGLVGGCPDYMTNVEPADGTTIDCDDTPFVIGEDTDGSDVYPGAVELCDGRDNDCDGALAEGDPEDSTVVDEVDRDEDGFVACDSVVIGLAGGDCGPDDARAFPGQEEYYGTEVLVVGGYDFNCNDVEEFEIEAAGGCIPKCTPNPMDPFSCNPLDSDYCRFHAGWALARPESCGDSHELMVSCSGVTAPCDPYSWGTADTVAECH